jgi:predicted anti-sigma-YlaC factor YlaD
MNFAKAAKLAGAEIKTICKTANVKEEDHFHKCPRCRSWFDARNFEDMVTHMTEECQPVH